MSQFTPRELATILHALRMMQEQETGTQHREDSCTMMGACDHFEDETPLDPNELDVLCERINLPPVAQCVTDEELSAEAQIAFLQSKLDRIEKLVGDSDHMPSWDAEAICAILNEPDVLAKQAEKIEALAEATRLQHEFWDALSDLERTFGIEDIDGDADLGDVTVEDLEEQAKGDGQ